MIKINDSYYELNLIDIIKELKSQLELNGIFLFNQIKDINDDILVSCPFHKDGHEKKASCGIRKSDGFSHCFSCGETATLEQLISRCFGHNDLGQFGINWLKKNFLGDILESRNLNIDLSRNIDKQVNTFITLDELDNYRYYHPYMFKRKMTEDIINKFDIGYDKNTNCLTFPIRDENGNCLFIARRNVDYKYFNYPQSVQKPVYGIYELKKYAPKYDTNLEVIVCESMINTLTCWVYGKYAVALNGTGTQYQYDMLKKIPCRKLILALDPDKAGRKGMIRLYSALKKYKIITFLKGIPEGKDINDLTKDEFDSCYESFSL